MLDIQFFQLPAALSVSENRPLPRNFRDKWASALLYLDFRIYFSFPATLPVSENRPLPRNFRDKRASALLYLDFHIYFSFLVALPVSEKDCSHAFSATNEYHLCFA
ncbi:hypothetical protein P9232_02385 [Weizmannia sp. CD-2023]|uniref:hypothetical protein n=1 Tax=Heyndrickxia TaxID=2837504 RepID=UPI002E249925|nr:hypothetical protein [Weizmannia sp. CD-2023]